MLPLSAGDMRTIALTAATDAGTTAEVTIPVDGGAGVNLGAIGWALGIVPSTVRINGYFVSRGPDFVSALSWDSLLSFFAARGLPAGSSILDSIVVQGKLMDQAGWHSSPDAEYTGRPGFKRKHTITNERSHKKNRLFEVCSDEQNVGIEQANDDDFLSIKRRLKLADEHPSKKGKVVECNSDCNSSNNMKNAGREGTTEDENIQRKSIFLQQCSKEQKFVTEQDNSNGYFLKRKLVLNDDHPFKKVKIEDLNSGLCNEASKLAMVFTKTG